MSDEGAQSVVEFALLAMVLLIIFAGVVDFSRFMYFQTAVDNAATGPSAQGLLDGFHAALVVPLIVAVLGVATAAFGIRRPAVSG